MLTKLNTQLALLTQPRHLDSISRRLKLLISDLDRLSNVNAQSGPGRRQNQHGHTASVSLPPSAPSQLQEQLLPLLARLAPHLPHLPHLLTRLRTLSTLHTSAADFQGTLNALEEEQRRVRGRLSVLAIYQFSGSTRIVFDPDRGSTEFWSFQNHLTLAIGLVALARPLFQAFLILN